MIRSNFFLLLFILCTLFACKEEEKVAPNDESSNVALIPKNNRLIGIDLLDRTESNTFDDNLELAKELGIEFIALHVPWTQIETSPNIYDDPNDALFLLGQTAERNGFQLSLTIRPIDLSGKTVPNDLENLRFNDSVLVQRFKQVVDFVFTKVNASVLLNFQIGNEIDGYNTSLEPSTFWTDYTVFLQEIKAHIQTTYPDVKVGYTGTLKGLNQRPNLFNQVLNSVDLLGVTYYPIKSDFTVESPGILNSEFDLLLSNYPDKPIYVQELGYQTATRCNSNEQQQADFFARFFSYWDQHANRIRSVNIVRLNDLSVEAAEAAALPYNLSDSTFYDYLRTIGIRNYSGTGTNKLAFDTLKQKLKERGW